MIALVVDLLFDFLYIVLIVGALLTWVPRMPIDQQPFKGFIGFCNLFFMPFRKLIPPLGGIDFSPVFAFITLGILHTVINEILARTLI